MGGSQEELFYEKTTDTQMYLETTKFEEPMIGVGAAENACLKPVVAKRKDQVSDYSPQIVFNVLNQNKNVENKEVSPSTAKTKIDEKRSQLSKYSDNLSQPILETKA